MDNLQTTCGADMTVDELVDSLNRWKITASTDEFAVHDSIAQILDEEKIQYAREVVISKTERLDFLCDGGIAIEVKTAGSVPSLVLQLQRYSDSDFVNGIVVVSTQRNHRLPVQSLGGKPLRVIWIFSQL